jgi:hypothetical protein
MFTEGAEVATKRLGFCLAERTGFLKGESSGLWLWFDDDDDQ